MWRAYHGRRLVFDELEIYEALVRAGARHPDLLRVCSHCRTVWEMQRNRPTPIRPVQGLPLAASADLPQLEASPRNRLDEPALRPAPLLGLVRGCEGPFSPATHGRPIAATASGPEANAGAEAGAKGGAERFEYEVVVRGALPDYLTPHLDGDHCVTDDAEVAGFFDYLVELGLLRKL